MIHSKLTENQKKQNKLKKQNPDLSEFEYLTLFKQNKCLEPDDKAKLAQYLQNAKDVKKAEREAKQNAINQKKEENESKGFRVTQKGEVNRTDTYNYMVALKELYLDNGHSLQYDTFRGDILYDGEIFSENHFIELLDGLIKNYAFQEHRQLQDAIRSLARSRSVNPIKNTLDSYVWDGKKRLATFFIDYLGAEDCDYVKEATKKWFMALIKRTMSDQFIKFDNILILQDKAQGTGKTFIFSRLRDALCNTYNSDLLYSVGEYDMNNQKDFDRHVNSSAIVLFDELGAFLRKDVAVIKSLLSRETTRQRRVYSANEETLMMRGVYVGTTNETCFLNDYSQCKVGSSDIPADRRFWIIPCHGTKRNHKEWADVLPDEYIEQVLAEAYYEVSRPDNPDLLNLNHITHEFELASIQNRFRSFKNAQYYREAKSLLNSKYNAPINANTPDSDLICIYRTTVQNNYVNCSYTIDNISHDGLATLIHLAKIKGISEEKYGPLMNSLGFDITEGAGTANPIYTRREQGQKLMNL